jgi:molybdopterin/thiamine biosynthesis adenylyltransferase
MSRRTTRCGRFAEIDVDAPLSGAPARPKREARLPAFLGLEEPPAPRLDNLRVMGVGCGSVGSGVALHLARLQVRELWLVDPGRLKAESLLTHPMEPGGVGMPKVEYFGRMAKQISPATRVRVFDGPVQSLSLAAFEEVDVAVLATDNLAAEVFVGQRCIHHRTPLVQASVHGDTLVAQVRFWLNRDARGPCPACSFGAAEWGHVNRETRFKCEPDGGQDTRHVTAAPTMSVSFLCSMSADMAMVQLLRHVLGLGRPLEDSVVEYCGYTHQVSTSALRRNLLCPCQHVAWDRATLPGPLGRMSLQEIAGRAGFNDGVAAEDLAYMVDAYTFVEQVVCCGIEQRVGRFVETGAEAAQCSRCGSSLGTGGFYCYRTTPSGALTAVIGEPLDRLGAGGAEWVVVSDGRRSVFCRQEV